MIRIATRLGFMASRYLVRGYYENRFVSAPEIAEHYNMNVRAVMPSLRQLTRMGILRSRVGGNTPGFLFSKDPQKITLHEIFIALEGDNHFECCKELIPELECDCELPVMCGLYRLFHEIIIDASQRFSTITIAEYAKEL